MSTSIFRFGLVMVLVGLGASCNQRKSIGPTRAPSPVIAATPAFRLQSGAFRDSMPIPEKFTGFGPDVSPPLSWSGTPSGTQSLALIMDDPDAPFGTFNHWMIFNLPPDSTELPENMPSQARLSDGSRQLRNGMLKYGYSGPHPPPGKVHHYNFVLCALDRVLPADGIDTKANLQEAMKGHILGQARLTGTCKR